MAVRPGLSVTLDRVAALAAGVAELASLRVMVGVPEDKTSRRSGDITNAALAYIHENGAPEVNIPARPFLVPGIENARDRVTEELEKAGRAALAGRGAEAVRRFYERAGTIARDSVKRKITEGPFVPLKPATIAARRRRSPGSRYRRRAQTAADVRPLIDTGALRNSINYVIRQITRKN